MQSIPSTMQAAVVHEYGGQVTVEERQVSVPSAGEVLVRIAAAPVHPADYIYTRGEYGFRKPLPSVVGIEASGVVVAVGQGIDESMIGQRVACFAGAEDGAWAEYMCTGAANCIPLPAHIDDEQGALMIVNPVSAYALMEMVNGVPAVVNTAAASLLGRMMLRLAMRRGIEMINVVRRDEQVLDLQSLGAKHVLNCTAPDFESRLHELCHRLNARIAFDAVSGTLSGQVLRAMPDGSYMVVYGFLSFEPCAISPHDLIFRGKSVDGFWAVTWLAHASMEKLGAVVTDVLTGIGGDYRSEIRARYPLSEARRALEDHRNHMSGGVVLMKP